MKKRSVKLMVFLILILFVFVLLIQLVSSKKLLEQEKINILQENINKFESEILDEFNKSNQTFVKIIIILKNKSEANNIFSNFFEDEIYNIINPLTSEDITARITEDGFYKLIQDDRIEKVYFNRQLYFTLDKSVPLVNANDVWNLGYTGDGVKVCVIDSGVNASHPDLSAKIVKEKCYCEDNCCSGGTNESNDATDNDGHGTHVTGIIASQDSTYKGVAYDADIYMVKVGLTLDALESDVKKAIDWCRSEGADVISISLGNHGNYPGGGTCPTYLDTSINNAYNAGIPVIIASGNNGYKNGISYPACSPNAISVGAVYDENVGSKAWGVCTDSTTTPDKIVCFTNRGNNLDILAPGSVITSLDYQTSGMVEKSGTSMACPHVAGAAALLFERDPTLTPSEIKEALQDTSKYIYDGCTGCSNLTFPRLDILYSINNICTCTSWSIGSCGDGGCGDYEKPWTRICTPSGCDVESDCKHDDACVPGGGGVEDITVCESGCDYTTIGDAIDNSDETDRIYVTDSRTYDEKVYMDEEDTAGWLKCTNGATIDNDDTVGVWIEDVEGSAVIDCNIRDSDICIRVWESRALIQGNNLSNCGVGILGDTNVVDLKIKENNIIDSTTYGIYFEATSWTDDSVNAIVEDNIIEDSGSKGIYMQLGFGNTVKENDIFGSSDVGDYGFHLYSNDHSSEAEIHDNFIYENYNGLYLDVSHRVNFSNNVFCSSNTNFDIGDNSDDTTGDNNRCEKPGVWNDSGTTGCTFYCDEPATATLLYPYNNFIDIDGNVDFTCQADDDTQLVNVSLYHNITGTWHANETKNISGTSNITTFTINNIANGTIFIWNCFVYDNKSRGGFADANWSVNVNIDVTPPNITATEANITIAKLNEFVRINCTATDSGIGIDSFLIEADKPISANENYSTSLLSGNTYYSDIQLTEIGIWNFNCWVNDTLNNLANKTDGSVDVIPDDTHKFIHKNSTGDIVAWIGNEGNVVLKGNCFSGGSCDNPGPDSFIIANSTDDHVAFINSTGDLCVEVGDCSDQSATCDTSPEDAFIYQNSSGNNVFYLDKYGDLCLTGELYENADL